MKIAMGSDFAGFPLKENIKKFLFDLGYDVIDFGTDDPSKMTPYYIPASQVANAIQSGECEKGILCCGTGAGMNIVANKFKGIYAVVCEGVFTANRAAVINDANVLTFGDRVIGMAQACECVRTWLSTKYLEGFPAERHQFLRDAFTEVQKLEELNFK